MKVIRVVKKADNALDDFLDGLAVALGPVSNIETEYMSAGELKAAIGHAKDAKKNLTNIIAYLQSEYAKRK